MSDARTPTVPGPSDNRISGASLTAQVRKTLGGNAHDFSLDVEFQAESGFTILFGASGAGKTTLLNCLTGLATPDSGRVAIGPRILYDSSAHTNLVVAKRRLGYVFQNGG